MTRLATTDSDQIKSREYKAVTVTFDLSDSIANAMKELERTRLVEIGLGLKCVVVSEKSEQNSLQR